MRLTLRNLYYSLPLRSRYAIRRIFYLPYDLFVKRTYNDLRVPSKGRTFTGGGDFIKKGESFCNILRNQTLLKPDHRVLEIGCGLGRMAYPLTQYLDPVSGGSYHGFDIVEEAIRWCNQEINAKYPHFDFSHIPLHNDLYQSAGADASGYEFPFADSTFNRIFATSVFTHLLPAELENYLQESTRVLQTGGMMLFTFFVMDKSEKLKNFDFHHDYGHYLLMSNKVKRANVAYRQDYLFDYLKSNHLEIVHYSPGSWQYGLNPLDFQDILVLQKL